MFKRIQYILILLVFLSGATFAQLPVNTLTFEEVLEMARDYSPQSMLAKHQFRAAYWEHRTFEAEYLPSLSLNGTLPNFRRIITQEYVDGTYKYVEANTNTLSLGLTMNQNIGLTGGRIFMQSSLERVDIFGNNTSSSYKSDPVMIGFEQPIFGFNQLKWKKKIEPLKYLEAKRTYLESMEFISGEAVRLFFDLILAQQNVKTAQLN